MDPLLIFVPGPSGEGGRRGVEGGWRGLKGGKGVEGC